MPWEEAHGTAPTLAVCPVRAMGQDNSAPVFNPRKLAAGSHQVGDQELTTVEVMG